MRKSFAAALLAALLPTLTSAQCFDNRNDLLAAVGAFSVEEDFESFATDTDFATPVPIAVGTLGTLNPIGFRNFIDTPPFFFTDNNGTRHASCYMNGDVPVVEVEIVLSRPASAFGCSFSTVGPYEDVELAFFSAGQLQATCAVAASGEIFTDRFRGYRSAGTFDTVRLRSASSVSGPAGAGGGLDDIVVAFGIGAHYCSPALNNSTGQPAWVTALGSTTVADDDLTLAACGLPPGQFGYFLVGAEQGMFVPPFSSGVFCVGCVSPLCPGVGRFSDPAQIILGPSGSLAVDLGMLPLNPPLAVVPGDTWNFQCWYRDVGTSNFTDAVSIGFL